MSFDTSISCKEIKINIVQKKSIKSLLFNNFINNYTIKYRKEKNFLMKK